MGMDGNKVQSLRQQFEVLSYNDGHVPKSKSTSNFPDFIGRHGEERNMMYSGNRNGFIETSSSVVPPKYHHHHNHHNNIINNQVPAKNTWDIKPSPPPPSSSSTTTEESNNNNRRNGIYVSNSITLHSEPGDNNELMFTHQQHHDGGGHDNEEDEEGTGSSEHESQVEKNENFNNSDNNSQNGVAVYGKVKRSNAFRKKDVIVVDPLDSRLVKTKLSLERVKSLDTSGLPGSGGYQKKSDNEINRTSSVCVRSVTKDLQQQQQQQQQRKVINVVQPYQVSEVYGHVKNFNNNSNQPIHSQDQHGLYQQQQQYLPSQCFVESDYAVPAVPIIDRSSPHHNNINHHHHHHHNNSNNYNEISPPIPPPPSAYHLQNTVMPFPTSTDRPLSVSLDSHSNQNTNQEFNSKHKNNNNSSSLNSVVSSPLVAGIAPEKPPEKPPRTFLYDILSDPASAHYQQQQHQQRPLSTTTNKAVITKSQRLRNEISGGFYYPNDSSPSVIKAAQALSFQPPPERTKHKQGIPDVNIMAATDANTGKPKVRNSGPYRAGGHHPNQQTLTRSKTESQLIVKNKNRSWDTTLSHHGLNNNTHHVHNNMNSSIGNYSTATSTDYNNAHIHRNARVNTANNHPHNVGIAQYGRIMVSDNSGLGVCSLPPHYTEDRGKLLGSGHGMMGATIINNNVNNNSGKSANVNRSRIDDRLCEKSKSKSEWSLHQVLSGSDASSSVVGISGGRRNTVANTNSNNIHHTGNLSLESNNSSNNNNSTKLFRSTIQQSIQNLMLQLFSPSSINGKDATSSTDSGIQLGSESLSSCDTPDTGDSDVENEVETSNNARQVVEARKGYILKVSSFRLGTLQNSDRLNSKKPQSGEPLFESLLVVGLNRDIRTGSYHPYIKESYPPNAKLAAGVEQFCFPDSLNWPENEGLTAQTYSLAITDQYGKRKYGFCFRILPEGANICIPITYCLISSNRSIGFYREVLKEITLRHGYCDKDKRIWMEQLCSKRFPSPDGNVTFHEPVHEETYVMNSNSSIACYNGVHYRQPKTITTIRRKADHRLDDRDLVSLLTKIDVATIIKILGTILHERKVVLISRALSTLSLCVEALESMLFPFTWQHTFIPILPLNMTDFLDAPSPFLIGVLKSSQAWDKNFEDGIVVDLDANKVVKCVGDEGSILPKSYNKKLRDSLQFVLNLNDQGESTKNVLISECFIRMFVDLIGHYGNHMVRQHDGLKVFDREAFIKASETKAAQNFLDWFSETSMFQYFIDSRLNKQKHGLFEQRIMGDQTHQNNYGAPLSTKNAKLKKNFGMNWFKDAFVMK